ncbi:MAG: ATP-binding protein [Acetatifactor sp.]
MIKSDLKWFVQKKKRMVGQMNRTWEDMVKDSVIIEETSEIVIVFDLQGRVLYGNAAARENLNYTGEELQKRNMSELFWQEFQRENGDFAEFDIEKLKGKKETAMYRKNSSCFAVTIRLFPLEDNIEVLLAEDITFRNNMNIRIRQLKEEEETNRRQRNEFTANVTHELRTPVNGIKGHVTNLLERIQNEEQRNTLEIILYCCDNMSAIINNILDFSKIESGKFSLDETEFDFYNMMDRIISTHAVEINKKELHLSVYVDENIPQFVIGDALRVGQILNNLLSNAVKFTLVGQISVDVSKTMQINDEVELFFMVRDTGIGISKEEQDRLFQSFKQVDASITRRFGGTGLGLSITKQLVEMMNGTIHVESEKGKGSCFSFSIRLKLSNNSVKGVLPESCRKWTGTFYDSEEQDNSFKFGSENNKREINKRMEKLILCIELGSWDKAETLAETIKALTEGSEGDMKRSILRLEMAIRKENHEKSMAAYEQLKTELDTLLS